MNESYGHYTDTPSETTRLTNVSSNPSKGSRREERVLPAIAHKLEQACCALPRLHPPCVLRDAIGIVPEPATGSTTPYQGP